MESPEKVETPQEGSDKVAKQYEANIAKLVALMSGSQVFKKPKVKTGDVAAIIEELVAERTENIKKEFKEKASKLIDAKVEFDKFVKQKEKEFQDAITNKKKEFNKEMDSVFGLLESIDEIKKNYESSLTV
jgi:molecular chaperone GrpE (heat shock protein)